MRTVGKIKSHRDNSKYQEGKSRSKVLSQATAEISAKKVTVMMRIPSKFLNYRDSW